jgi:hypothetical protein
MGQDSKNHEINRFQYVEELTYTIWIFSLLIEIEDPRVKNRGSKVRNQSELRRLSERKGRTLPLLALCSLDRPRSLRSAHVCEPPDLGTGNRGDFCTDHGYLALDTHLGKDCCGDAGVPAVLLGYLSQRLQGQGISAFANSIITSSSSSFSLILSFRWRSSTLAVGPTS